MAMFALASSPIPFLLFCRTAREGASISSGMILCETKNHITCFYLAKISPLLAGIFARYLLLGLCCKRPPWRSEIAHPAGAKAPPHSTAI